MKIVTWNINSVRIRIELLKKICQDYNPDVICLQETKVTNDLFPIEEIKNLGFEHIVFEGEKSYNGVAILSKFKIENSFSLSLYNDNKRHICALINDVEVHNFYVPAGGDVPDINLNPKFKHKLEFLELMKSWFADNRKIEDKIILVGDLNIAPHENDVWSSKQLRNIVSHTMVERESLLSLQKSFDFIDTGRHFINLDEKLYSWWSYRNKDWKKSNRGRRLDHIWVSQSLKSKLDSTIYPSELRDCEKPSDHIPCLLQLKIT